MHVHYSTGLILSRRECDLVHGIGSPGPLNAWEVIVAVCWTPFSLALFDWCVYRGLHRASSSLQLRTSLSKTNKLGLTPFDVFSTVHHSIELFHYPTLMHNSLFITVYMLHYYPRHVSSINMPIFRRKNCIHTASVIVALCKRLRITPVESRLQSALNRCTMQPFTESEDTRCCVNTIFPPEDGHINARNMSRIIV